MILIFDLDDTLYDERSYVDSGLRAVAGYGQARFGWDAGASFDLMTEVLEAEGRGRIFDAWLAAHGKAGRGLIEACVRVYRHHAPAISLSPAGRRALDRCKDSTPLYLVTDGHKLVQTKKVEALGIAGYFRRILITHRFGRARAKPSAYCFELIRAQEGCGWRDMVYVADNPAKDFVSLNQLGMPTIRVLTGEHRGVVASPGWDGRVRIESLDALPPVIAALEAEAPQAT